MSSIQADLSRPLATPTAGASRTPATPVFLQDWWQEAAVSAGAHHDVEVELAGRPAGRLRYVTHRNKIGARLGLAPFWTHLGGPVLAEGLSPQEAVETARMLIRRLPRGVSFRFMCDPCSPHASAIRTAFLAEGFSRERHRNFLQCPADSPVLARMKSKHRTQLKSAMRRVRIETGSPEEFIAFYEANLETPSHSPLAVAEALMRAGLAAGQIRLFFAVNDSGAQGLERIDAAVACAWDSERYYYWLSRRRLGAPGAPRPDGYATRVALLAAIDHARELGLVFDADCPESVGGQDLFETLFAFERIEHRDVFVRRTALTALYDRAVPLMKRLIKSAFPKAPLYMPKIERRN